MYIDDDYDYEGDDYDDYAFPTADQIAQETAKNSVNRIHKRIVSQAEKGKAFARFEEPALFNIIENQKDILEELGYEVIINHADYPDDEDVCFIIWDEQTKKELEKVSIT